MCLLVSQPAPTSFTDDFLIDVYSKNADGLGVMYAEAGKLHVYKALPANKQDFIDFYRVHAEGRACVWHARMRTHGEIDQDNCHPYRVTDDIYLAHNGILSAGNSADHTKSDTWHFIKNVLRPALSGDPSLIEDPEWVDFMGCVIGGSNKFAILRSDGASCIINRRSGVEFCNSWLSNTYAWSPSRFGFRDKTTHARGYYPDWFPEDDGYQWQRSSTSWQSRAAPGFSGVEARPASSQALTVAPCDREAGSRDRTSRVEVQRFARAAYNQYARRGLAGIEQWVRDAPYKAASVLSFWYDDLPLQQLTQMATQDPEEAAVWVCELFESDSIKPSWLG